MNDIYAGRDCRCGHPLVTDHDTLVCAVYGRHHPTIERHIDCRTTRIRLRQSERLKEAI